MSETTCLYAFLRVKNTEQRVSYKNNGPGSYSSTQCMARQSSRIYLDIFVAAETKKMKS